MVNEQLPANSMSLACEGIRVLELTEALAGPYCAMMLGDFGADVIKVERPGVGDQTRAWGPPFVGTESCYFLMTNRNKRSMTLNYDNPQGLEILNRMIAATDVLLVNNPNLSSLQKRHIDPEAQCSKHPRLIYLNISGYGFNGPKAGLPGYDIVAQAEGGVWSFTGEEGTNPVRYPVAIVDISTGIYSTIAVLTALFARERTGRGQFIDMALFDTQLTWLANIGSNYLNAHEMPTRWGNGHASIVPYDVFKGGDGKLFILAAGSEAHWSRLLPILDAEETLGKDPRFTSNKLRVQHRKELNLLLQDILASCPANVWLSKLAAVKIPAGPIHTVDEALTDPQTLARSTIVEIEHPTIGMARSIANPCRLRGTPPLYRCPPPLIGEHTESVLSGMGFSAEDIQSAKRAGAI
jgi:crotonobetainyl-CoA:carnitine CoA-transferase CaiB-like acyl-CoA transferase